METNKHDSFALLREYRQLADAASNAADFFLAIADYALDGIEPQFGDKRDLVLFEIVKSKVLYGFELQAKKSKGGSKSKRNNPTGKNGTQTSNG